MKLISKFNKGFRFLLCVIDIFSKYTWFVLLKDKKGVTIVNASQNILDDASKRQSNPKDVNQTKYGLIKVVNFTITFFKKMVKR